MVLPLWFFSPPSPPPPAPDNYCTLPEAGICASLSSDLTYSVKPRLGRGLGKVETGLFDTPSSGHLGSGVGAGFGITSNWQVNNDRA